MTYQEKVEKYRNGEYIWEKPFPTGCWSEEECIRRIDLTDSWLFQEDKNRKNDV